MRAPTFAPFLYSQYGLPTREDKKKYAQYKTLRIVEERVDKDNKRHKERGTVPFHLSRGVSH
jgi:hypothetical protein